MPKSRFISSHDIKEGRLVKGVDFVDLRHAGAAEPGQVVPHGFVVRTWP